jgi:imidazolonepropionase-like amidohydrolase
MKKAIKNGKVFDHSSGTFLEDTTILWRDGVILQVGKNVELPSDTLVLDGNGRYITPGLIDGFTQLGLRESGIRWEGDDSHEEVEGNQYLYSVIDGIYPLDDSFQTARACGVTTVHVAPGPENVISGQTAIIKTSGTVVDEMIVNPSFGLSVSFGEMPKRLNREKYQAPMTRMGVAALLREQLRKSQYQANTKINGREVTVFDKVLSRELPLFIRVHRADDIMTALRFKEEFSLDLVLVHATEGHLAAEHIARAEVPVLAGPFFQARSRYELKDIMPQTAVCLHHAGVPISLITDHPTSSIGNLALEMALAIREGLSVADAVRAVTIMPAKVLGLDHKLGSIEAGKEADLVVWDGEPVELTTRVQQTFVGGEVVYSKEGVNL